MHQLHQIKPVIYISMSLLFFFTGLCQATESNNEPQYQLQLKNIPVRSLLVNFAEIENMNLIAGDEIQNKRIHLKYNASRLLDVITGLAQEQDLTVKQQKDILMIGSKCRLSRDLTFTNASMMDQRVTLNFLAITAGSLFAIFRQATNKDIDIPKSNNKSTLSIRIKNKPVTEHLHAIAITQGWSVTKTSDKSLSFRSVVTCPIRSKTDIAIDTSQQYSEKPRGCARSEGKNCMELEKYKLEEITPRGYILNKTTLKQTAFVETSDGVIHRLQVGHFLGQHYGELKKISQEGTLYVTGLVSDNVGGWRKKEFILKTGSQYEDPESKRLRLATAPVKETKLQLSFIKSVDKGELKLVNSLLDNKYIDINASYVGNKYNALVLAVNNGNAKMVQTLLDRGADPNLLVGKNKDAALHIASVDDNIQIVKALLNAGAEINIYNRIGHAPVVYAIENNSLLLTEFLLKHGASITHNSRNGVTPFTMAAYKGQLEVVKLFLETGLNVDRKDRNGYSMLHAAAHGKRLELVKFLIKKGANVNSDNRHGSTVLDTALNSNHTRIITYIKSKGAKNSGRKP